MAAECEVLIPTGQPCGVLAVGRCRRCQEAFCESHRVKYAGLCRKCVAAEGADQDRIRAEEAAAEAASARARIRRHHAEQARLAQLARLLVEHAPSQAGHAAIEGYCRGHRHGSLPKVGVPLWPVDGLRGWVKDPDGYSAIKEIPAGVTLGGQICPRLIGGSTGSWCWTHPLQLPETDELQFSRFADNASEVTSWLERDCRRLGVADPEPLSPVAEAIRLIARAVDPDSRGVGEVWHDLVLPVTWPRGSSFIAAVDRGFGVVDRYFPVGVHLDELTGREMDMGVIRDGRLVSVSGGGSTPTLDESKVPLAYHLPLVHPTDLMEILAVVTEHVWEKKGMRPNSDPYSYLE